MTSLAYSAAELAAALGVSQWTVYRQAKEGSIPSLLIGTRRVFPKAAIEQWLAGHEGGHERLCTD